MFSRVPMGSQWKIRAAFQVLNVQWSQPKTKVSLGPKDLAFLQDQFEMENKVEWETSCGLLEGRPFSRDCPGEEGAISQGGHRAKRASTGQGGTRGHQGALQYCCVTLTPTATMSAPPTFWVLKSCSFSHVIEKWIWLLVSLCYNSQNM